MKPYINEIDDFICQSTRSLEELKPISEKIKEQRQNANLILINEFQLDLKRKPFYINFNTQIEQVENMNILNANNQFIKNHMSQMIRHEISIKLLEQLVWICICIKFPNTIVKKNEIESISSNSTLQNLRKLKNSYHVRLKYEQKFQFLNEFYIICSLLIFTTIRHLFYHQKTLFDIRFFIDTCHITLFELNGNFVTDIYIWGQLEKLLLTEKLLIFQDKISDLIQPSHLPNPQVQVNSVQNVNHQQFLKQLQNKIYLDKVIKNKPTQLQINFSKFQNNKPKIDHKQLQKDVEYQKFNCTQVSAQVQQTIDKNTLPLSQIQQKVISKCNSYSTLLQSDVNYINIQFKYLFIIQQYLSSQFCEYYLILDQ